MEMQYGYGGTILHVDLTTGRVTKEHLEKEIAKTWLGGRGLNMKVLWERVKPHTEPVGLDNVLLFGFGPLTGTLVAATNGCNVSAKSPLTGHVGDSSARGHFGNEAKYAGYDQIIITGISERPVYLLIVDDQVTLRDASHLWGENVGKTVALIKQEVGDNETKVCCIGPAGENLVKTAAIIFDDRRAAGRTGMGAVMGSKNLKAVAVRGTKGVRIARPQEFEDWIRNDLGKITHDSNYKYFARYGTIGNYVSYGIEHPTKNFQSHLPPHGCDWHYHEQFVSKYVVRCKGCSSCPIHCSRFYEICEGPYAGTRGGGVELDSFKGVGTQLGHADIAGVIHTSTLADELGLDVICTGDAIGLAMELYQRGIISRRETDGVELEWGSIKAIETMLIKIAKREGFGNVLAEGSRNAARIIGPEAEKYDMSIKGLSHQIDVRDGLHRFPYLTSTRGHDHLRGDIRLWLKADLCEKFFGDPTIADLSSPQGKAKLTIFSEHLCAIADSLHRCKFARVLYGTMNDPLSFDEIAVVLSATTGLEWTGEELQKIGERIYNIEQAFCCKEGISRKDYYPPWRMVNEPIPDGPRKGQTVTNEQWTGLLNEYFTLRDWNVHTAIPSRGKLEELGLDYVADAFEEAGS